MGRDECKERSTTIGQPHYSLCWFGGQCTRSGWEASATSRSRSLRPKSALKLPGFPSGFQDSWKFKQDENTPRARLMGLGRAEVEPEDPPCVCLLAEPRRHHAGELSLQAGDRGEKHLALQTRTLDQAPCEVGNNEGQNVVINLSPGLSAAASRQRIAAEELTGK